MTKHYTFGDTRLGAGKEVDGGRLKLMARSADLPKFAAGQAENLLIKAKTRLRNAIAKLNSGGRPEVAALAKKYFLCDPLSGEDTRTIHRILELTLNGLSGDVTIKTGHILVKGNNGYVNSRTWLKAKYGEEKKPHIHVTQNLETGAEKLSSDIQIRYEVLMNDDLGLEVLIHEATHRYAGTIDYCYMDDKTADPKVETERKTPFNDKKLALMNADSYGYFVFLVGATP